ncbi:hypothetical protein DYB32_002090 [Aphanomyces invadans]|uniref:Protein kinase domain-containing protein n=1 Tax=Aphanomyces invadans TaxID=157072 RepID=A0A3R6VFS0_9STRA|nr:hypothetical protein DYB32_002090 [Aphanomyces invadans]
MGCVASSVEPAGISVETHKFVNANKAGTLANSARVRLKTKGDDVITESRQLGTVFFGLNVPFKEIDVRSTLGAGNFGVVYEAYCKGKRVAVKKIYLRDTSEKSIELVDFAQEVDILSQLIHPNIVHFLGAVQEHPNYCLITELCEGSAENLLITELFRCKLSDFGLSRSLEKDAIANTVCGTPRWVAPEVYRGDVYSEKIDIYSYGIVLWYLLEEADNYSSCLPRELFCFKKPYLDQDPINLPYMVVHKNLRPPLCAHIPTVLHDLMKACWHPDPSQRPSFHAIRGLLDAARKEVILNLSIDTTVSYDEAVAQFNRKSSTGMRVGFGLKSGLL